MQGVVVLDGVMVVLMVCFGWVFVLAVPWGGVARLYGCDGRIVYACSVHSIV